MMSIFNKADDISRRGFVEGMAAAALGMNFVPAYSAEKALAKGTAEHVIFLYMSGGMSHIDTLDTKPDNKSVQGPVKSIKTSADGIRISEYLPNLAKQMHHATIFNSLTTSQGAHAQGNYYMHTSYQPRGTIKHPHMGAWMSYFLGKKNATLPCNVKISSGSKSLGAGFMDPKHGALPIGDPKAGLQNSKLPNGVTDKAMSKRLEMAAKMNAEFQNKYNQTKVKAYSDMYKDAIKLMNSKDLAAFDITKERKSALEAYGDNKFGNGCLLARRLVEHGVRFVEVGLGGWDTHDKNFERVPENSETLDKALGALIADLHSRGLLKKTLVVLTTEFGRTPKIVPGKNGRNHYPKAFSALMAGGGIKGGFVYGKTDKNGAEIVKDKVKVPDFNATIAKAVGIDVNKKIFSKSGRPFNVSKKGKPINDVFA